MDEKGRRYDNTDPKSIEDFAQDLIGHTFREVINWDESTKVKEDTFTYGSKKRKGGLGNLLEELYFGYEANSDRNADFNEAGVELKVTPYERRKNGKLSAGERLVLTMLSYEEAVEPDFYKSHLWAKCQLLLLIYYLRDRSLDNNLDYRIDYAKLFSPPKEDLEIIEHDYKKIINKVSAGRAHELSESDTMYLGACTKGATAEKSTVPQKYYAPDIKARKRAFCFKTSYMTYVLNSYMANEEGATESIIKDPTELANKTFEEIVIDKIDRYKGKTDKELCSLFGRDYNNNKAQWIDLAYRMLGIKSNKAEEFEKANIVVKAIRVEADGKIRENSPLPTFRFKDLVEEEWEESELYKYFDEKRFLFVVFQSTSKGYVLKGCKLWNMPYTDLNETVYKGWYSIRKVVQEGVVFTHKGNRIDNNFPAKKENRIIHIRPHAQKAFYVFEDGSTFGNGSIKDTDELPDGRRMTKQSFWLNNTYIFDQLKSVLEQEGSSDKAFMIESVGDLSGEGKGMKKTVCELFAGVGGFRLGLEKADPDWETVWFSQWEPGKTKQWAHDCYVSHWGDVDDKTGIDISEVKKSDIPDHNLLVGGFPCQDYSVARPLPGSKGLEGKKGVLWWQIRDTLEEKKAPFGLFENVDRLLKSPASQRGRDFGIMLACLADLGYSAEWRVINAAEYGAAQRRRRVFIFAYKNDTNYGERMDGIDAFDVIATEGFFAKTFPIKKIEKQIETTEIDYHDIPEVSDSFRFQFENAGYMKDGKVYTVKTEPIEESATPLSDIIQSNVDEKYFLTGDKLEKWKYLKGAKRIERESRTGHKYTFSEGAISFPDPLDKPARTMLTSEGTTNRSSHVVEDPQKGKLRIITPLEAERIQGFEDNWTDTMPERMRYFCMGNALVVPMITRMGKTLNTIFENE